MAAAANTTPTQDSITGEIATAVKHSIVYGFGGFLIKGVGFFLLPLYTHFLTPRDYGTFEVLELSISLLAMFLNMGVTAALLRYYGAADTEAEKRRIVGSIFALTVAVSAIVLAGASVSIRQLTTALLGPDVPAMFLFLSIGASLIAYIANVPYTALRGKEASGTVVTVDTGTTVATYALTIYLIVVMRWALYGMLLSRLIVNALTILILIKLTRREVFGGLDWGILRRVMKFGAPLVLSNLTLFTLNFSDRFFLQRFESLEVVGIYAVAYKFGYMLNFLLIQPFNMMWQARMYIVYRAAEHRKVFSRIFVLYSMALIYAALGMSVLAPELMRLMVDFRYSAGQSVIPIIALSYVFLGIASYVQLGMYLTSQTGVIGIISAVAAVINLGANYFLIKYFGMLGAAWATALGFLVIAIGSYYYSERFCPLALPLRRVCRALAVAAAVCLVSRAATASILATALLIKGLLLIVGFPILLWICGCLSPDEIATLNSLRTGVLRLVRPIGVRI